MRTKKQKIVMGDIIDRSTIDVLIPGALLFHGGAPNTLWPFTRGGMLVLSSKVLLSGGVEVVLLVIQPEGTTLMTCVEYQSSIGTWANGPWQCVLPNDTVANIS